MRVLLSVLFLAFGAQQALAECAGRLVESEHIYKSPICVPDDPERVLVVDPTFSLGMSIELGVPVVAAPLFAMSDEKLRATAEDLGIADIGSYFEPSIEKIIAAQPDLILGVQLAAPYYDLLNQVAPTVLIGGTGDWRAHFETLALAVGRSDAMRGMFDAYDRRAADIKARMPDVTVSVVRITSWDFQVYLDKPEAYGPFSVLRDAGVRRTDYETSDMEGLKRPDWEELAELDGDILLYIIGGSNDSDINGRHEEVLENPLWQMLPAVQAGRVHRVDPGIWMEFSGLDSANRVLDDIERYILAAP